MARPLKPALASREGHDPPRVSSHWCFQGVLPQNSRLSSPKDSKSKCSLLHNLWLTPPCKEQRHHCNRPPLSPPTPFLGKDVPLSHLSPACSIHHEAIFFLGEGPVRPAQRPGRQRGGKKKGFSSFVGYGICSSCQRTPGEEGELHLCSLFIIQLHKELLCRARDRSRHS